MTTDPATQFGAIIQAQLAGRPLTAPATEAPAAPPVPRLPAPNRAQGSSGTTAPATPITTFEDAVRAAVHGPPGGWRQVTPW